jgi:hypothetical protein
MNITKEQVISIRVIVSYLIEEERTHLEEEIATMYDVDGDDMEDKELAEFCKDKGIEHAWLELFNLSTI